MISIDELVMEGGKLDEYGELPVRVRNFLLNRILALLSAERERLQFVGVLGLICAQKSWPVWLEKFPGETEPISVIEDVVKAVIEGTPMPGARRRLDKLKVLIDSKLISGEEEEYFGASYSGLACWAAARDVIYGRQDWTTTGESEQNIDPDDWDASFYASIAVTGSSGWARNDVDHARQEFWTWYLHEAIPNAFARASE
jgi:hypothetical protein